ncbi:MAG: metal-dependent hydrolase [Sphingomonadales bacterium]|jgi:predicted metal-dependent hydrolase|nr:metal-dependent hydrolase [Sphingomonadales bacterium]MBK9002577.1 metal-dependent hydrolase [Sphingomonadales bacterium]MBK9267797.1 metal-dependent hydrolase [Sphingomonadales bacterium]MBP6433304.1 metal-dependent hydrolase [Sphingorhabdus sp.]
MDQQTETAMPATQRDGNPQGSRLHVRRFRGGTTKLAERHWVRGDMYATAFLNALSVVFPRGESFMIEALHPWKDRTEGQLREDISNFIAQEAAHSREHVGFNKGIIDAGYDIEALDRAIRQFVSFFSGCSEVTKLGATMCIEHLTAIVAAEMLKNREHLEGTDLELRKLWLWHAVEEVEHKAVAFDVWMFATREWSGARRWLTRSALLLAVSLSFFINRTRGQVELLQQDGLSKPNGWWQCIRHGFAKGAIGRNVMGPWIEFFRPGFHPHQIDDSELLIRGENMLAAIKLVTEGAAGDVVRTAPATQDRLAINA